jgi:hypothetical protein
LLLNSSCSQSEELAPLEFVKWIENPSNGLIVEKEKEDLIFKLQYKPIEYVVAVQERKRQLSKKVFEKAKSQMEGLQYFTFRISPADVNKPLLDKSRLTSEDYDRRINYFSFEMQHDLVLFDGQDSLRCLLFHYERAYNLNAENTFLLGFDLPNNQIPTGSKKLIFHDPILGTGQIELNIDQEDLARIPKLNLK